MSKATNPSALASLSRGLSAVSGRLDAAGAGKAADALAAAMSKTNDPWALSSLSAGLTAVSGRLDAGEAARHAGKAADALVAAMSKTNNPNALAPLSTSLIKVLTREDTAQSALIATVGAMAGPGPLAFPALLQPALRPLPPPLPAQDLVNLLKNPFCVGDARRLVLDQLQRHHGRPFADQWDFVRFARERKLDLDLTSPPRRLAPPR
jgi:hypothetical protein